MIWNIQTINNDSDDFQSASRKSITQSTRSSPFRSKITSVIYYFLIRVDSFIISTIENMKWRIVFLFIKHPIHLFCARLIDFANIHWWCQMWDTKKVQRGVEWSLRVRLSFTKEALIRIGCFCVVARFNFGIPFCTENSLEFHKTYYFNLLLEV